MYISDLITVVGYLHTAGFKTTKELIVPSVCYITCSKYAMRTFNGSQAKNELILPSVHYSKETKCLTSVTFGTAFNILKPHDKRRISKAIETQVFKRYLHNVSLL